MKMSDYEDRRDRIRFGGHDVLRSLVNAHSVTLRNNYYTAAEAIESAIYKMREDDIERFSELLNDVLHQEPEK